MQQFPDNIIAHISNDGRLQTLNDHASGVAQRCAQMLRDAGHETLAPLGEVLGWLHDLGKTQPAFQTYLRKVALEHLSAPKAPHSMVGASFAVLRELRQSHPHICRLLGYIISGHHRGLYDFDQLEEKLAEPATFERCKDCGKLYYVGYELLSEFLQKHGRSIEAYLANFSADQAQAIIRLCFSCLIDADFLDTEAFMDTTRQSVRQHTNEQYDNIATLRQRLFEHTNSFSADSPVNATRARFLAACRTHGAQCPVGNYSLFLPTGGGKTLSSMAWALEVAQHLGLQRIIYVIPYTSIIMQTAQVFKSIFGAHNVLEHHSEFLDNSLAAHTTDPHDEAERYSPYRLTCENWDAPIIVTTNVRFFESAFSHKVSASRKMHNVARAVLVFDEVQQFPNSFLNPMLRTLDNLREVFHTPCLFCSATLPSFDLDHNSPFKKKRNFHPLSSALHPVVELSTEDFHPFERVHYHLTPQPITFQDLAQQLRQHPTALCIVNSRKEAALLYNSILDAGATPDNLVHLSRNMHSFHLKNAIATVKQRVANGIPTLVVSTALIEAGVDLDFPVVYRAEAGLDSIIQAGGRCNREGRLAGGGEVHVVQLTESHPLQGDFRLAAFATADLLRSEGSNYSESRLDFVSQYYQRFFNRIDDFDKENIAPCLWHAHKAADGRFDFEAASQHFQLIKEEKSHELFVVDASLRPLIEQLRHHPESLTRAVVRQLQQYHISVHEQHYNTLHAAGWVEHLSLDATKSRQLLLLHPDGYDAHLGARYDNPFASSTLMA